MANILLPFSDEELLSQCKVEAFRASGAGGQHVNRTDSAVRLTHLPTGLVVTSQKERSQYRNKQDCLTKLRTLVARLNYCKPKRIPTRKSRGVRSKELDRKTKDSRCKQLRHPPSLD